jgi:hypothetical protein
MSENKLEYIEEGFSIYNKDIGLKTLLFSMLFYIIISKYVITIIKKNIPASFEVEFIQAIVFGIAFYIININL